MSLEDHREEFLSKAISAFDACVKAEENNRRTNYGRLDRSDYLLDGPTEVEIGVKVSYQKHPKQIVITTILDGCCGVCGLFITGKRHSHDECAVCVIHQE
jgi:hypothetical protein